MGVSMRGARVLALVLVALLVVLVPVAYLLVGEPVYRLTVVVDSRGFPGGGSLEVSVYVPGVGYRMRYLEVDVGEKYFVDFEFSGDEIERLREAVASTDGRVDLVTVTVYYVVDDGNGGLCRLSVVIDSYEYYLSLYRDPSRAAVIVREDPEMFLYGTLVYAVPDLSSCPRVTRQYIPGPMAQPPVYDDALVSRLVGQGEGIRVGEYSIGPGALEAVMEAAESIVASPYDNDGPGYPLPGPPCRQIGWDVAFWHLVTRINDPPAHWLDRLDGEQELKVVAWNTLVSRMAVARHFPKACSVGEVIRSMAYYTGLPEGVYTMDDLVDRLLWVADGGNGSLEWNDTMNMGEAFLSLPTVPLASLVVHCSGECPDMTASLAIAMSAIMSEKKGIALMGITMLGKNTHYPEPFLNSISLQINHETYQGHAIALLYGPVSFYYLFDGAIVYYHVEDQGDYYRVIPMFTYMVPIYDVEIVYDADSHGGIVDRYPGIRVETTTLEEVYQGLSTDAYTRTPDRMITLVYDAVFRRGQEPQGEKIASNRYKCNTVNIPGMVTPLTNTLVVSAINDSKFSGVVETMTLSTRTLGFYLTDAHYGNLIVSAEVTAQAPMTRDHRVRGYALSITGYTLEAPDCGAYAPPLMGRYLVVIGEVTG